jgi:tetratricopeptide (TPR) repeat protein
MNPDFYILKAKLFLEQEKSADAATAALTALKLSPRTISPILQISDDFYLREAKVVYAKTIELGAREVLPYLGLGNIALHYQDLPEAEKWFGEARQIKADHPAVLLAWGRLMLAKNDLPKSKEFLEQSREKGEDSGTLHGALGDVYFKLKLWDQSVDSYQRAFKNRRKNLEWRRNMGVAFAEMGKKRQAEQKFREVLALSPDDADAWRELRKLGVRY